MRLFLLMLWCALRSEVAGDGGVLHGFRTLFSDLMGSSYMLCCNTIYLFLYGPDIIT